MDEREHMLEVKPDTRKARKIILFILSGILLLVLGIFLFVYLKNRPPKGFHDYTIQIEQNYVEYSDAYDYWDVLTVDYPCLEGVDAAVQDSLNQQMYDTAMDRVNYWHLNPDETVQEFQEEHFSIFCSDVQCDVTFHSQYLLSIDYHEIYAPGNPVWMTNFTERALNVDLLTGDVYELADVVTLNEDFIRLWCDSLDEDLYSIPSDDETIELLTSWFQKTDEGLMDAFALQPFFCVLEDKDFIIGISLDPMPAAAASSVPRDSTFYAQITAESLEPFRTDSPFWEKYEDSENAGEVLACEDRQENLWLGEEASVWDYWENR